MGSAGSWLVGHAPEPDGYGVRIDALGYASRIGLAAAAVLAVLYLCRSRLRRS